MLYYFFNYLDELCQFPGAGLFEYLTFRSGLAVILSLFISVLIGGRVIEILKRKQVGESIRELGLQGQSAKKGTPTMGGLIILAAILVPTILLADISNIYVILLLITTVWMGVIGFIDDYIKVFLNNKDGLKARFKLFGQIGLGIVVASVMLLSDDIVVKMEKHVAIENHNTIIKDIQESGIENGEKDFVYAKSSLTNVPFFKGNVLDYSKIGGVFGEAGRIVFYIFFVMFVTFIVVSVSNAANLTDGIDGLTAGLSAIVAATLAILAYVSSNTLIANYLNILYIPYSDELVIVATALFGACIGFLWHNAYPAKVFMGDTGSLALGSIIAVLAILIRKELLIPILCGIFLLESLSVVLQVAYFKHTKRKYGEGKRIFLMSPLHHHFQKMGMHEVKIVTRFWIVGVLLAVITIVTLKVR